MFFVFGCNERIEGRPVRCVCGVTCGGAVEGGDSLRLWALRDSVGCGSVVVGVG